MEQRQAATLASNCLERAYASEHAALPSTPSGLTFFSEDTSAGTVKRAGSVLTGRMKDQYNLYGLHFRL